MAAVTLFTVVVKEGGIAKLTEVLLIVIIGGMSNASKHLAVMPTFTQQR